MRAQPAKGGSLGMSAAAALSLYLLYTVLHVYYCCSPASPAVCEEPTPASGVIVVQPHNTTVSSVIVYQCQQTGTSPSSPSSVCGEDERWNPDPSQVMCVTLPGTLRLFLQSAPMLKPEFWSIYRSLAKECPWVEHL